MATSANRGAGTQYKRPPIVEAVLSLSYQMLPHERLVDLQAFAQSLKSDYPEQNARFQQQAQVQFGAVTGYASTQREDGIVCVSKDRKRFAQFALDSVSFSRLAPYGSWDEFEEQSRPILDLYQAAITVNPTMLSIRYINRIEVPVGEPMEHYLRTYPEVSRDLPQLIGPYFMRLEVPIGKATLTMQQGFVQSSSSELYAILLDNDVRYDVNASDDLWQVAQEARAEKNRVFEACITDALRERLN